MPKRGYKSITIKEQIYNSLELIAKEEGKSIKVLTEKALNEFINKGSN